MLLSYDEKKKLCKYMLYLSFSKVAKCQNLYLDRA